jgi:hypothetical protein
MPKTGTGKRTLTAKLQVGSQGGEKKSSFLFKLVLSGPAHGAYPVPGQLFKRGSSLHAVVRITYYRIIHVTAHRTHIFRHSPTSSLKYSLFTLAKKQKMLSIEHHFAVCPQGAYG